MKRSLYFFAAAMLCSLLTGAQTGVHVNAGLRGDATSNMQYGIFFEEINHADDETFYTFCYGTDKYVAMVNAADNGNWYCGVKNGAAKSAHSDVGLAADKWHNVTYVQTGSNGFICTYGEKNIS